MEGRVSRRYLIRTFGPDKPDAPKFAAGAASRQEAKPIASESRKLEHREQFSPAYATELLAIIHALRKWRQLTGAHSVRAETGRATLARLLQQKNVTPRLRYWLHRLADFNLK